MPVIFNAVIVGLEIVMLTPVEGGKLTAFAISALEVGAGELAVCLVLGLPLYSALRHTKLLSNFQLRLCCYIAIPLFDRKGRQQ